MIHKSSSFLLYILAALSAFESMSGRAHNSESLMFTIVILIPIIIGFKFRLWLRAGENNWAVDVIVLDRKRKRGN